LEIINFRKQGLAVGDTLDSQKDDPRAAAQAVDEVLAAVKNHTKLVIN